MPDHDKISSHEKDSKNRFPPQEMTEDDENLSERQKTLNIFYQDVNQPTVQSARLRKLEISS